MESSQQDSGESPPPESTVTIDQPPPQPPSQIPLTWPADGTLTLPWVQNLMSTLNHSSRHLKPSDLPTILPVKVFDSLILTGSKILHKEANCVVVEPEGDGNEVVVVGDVHGQLHDVLWLLNEGAGLPNENRWFVFNGDYVDRGAWGLETFLILLAWKVSVEKFRFLC
ncbi:serine/threonine-protein phosphatase 7 [Tanacetum coccineum]|uniref:Serine/threonine-protein phosphatase 7 n=1 Tax=Tanacetum coccineum TaxID=301880 RepID=A0ABQ5ENN9_9ASTR